MKIIDRIHELYSRAANINYGAADWLEQDNKFWEDIKQLDADAGDGLVPGRHLRWQVADGYAHYIVMKVGKRETELAHMPIGDGYTFSGTYWHSDGKRLMVPTPVALQAFARAEWFRSIFATKS